MLTETEGLHASIYVQLDDSDKLPTPRNDGRLR